jgi:type I restriction enzyme M protein
VVLFFQKGSPTHSIWYYQLDPSRSIGKTNAFNDDFKEFVELQATFADSAKSWSVDVRSPSGVDGSTSLTNRTLSGVEGYDFSVKNPNKAEETPLRDPEVIINEVEALDTETAEILGPITIRVGNLLGGVPGRRFLKHNL